MSKIHHCYPWGQAKRKFCYCLFLFHIQSQDSNVGPVVLDVVRLIQEQAMNASYSVTVTKPVLTKNIRKLF